MEVIPGSALDDAMFELTASGVAEHAHAAPPSWERSHRPSWLAQRPKHRGGDLALFRAAALWQVDDT